MNRVALLAGTGDNRHMPSNINHGQPYASITYAEIAARAMQPPHAPLDKNQTDGIICADYTAWDLRKSNVGADFSMQMLTVDFDTGNYTKEQVVHAVNQALGGHHAFTVYSTFSAWTDVVDPATGEITNKGARWAVIIPLATAWRASTFEAVSNGFLDLLQAQGVHIEDRTSAQIKRIRFLPVWGVGGYDCHVQDGPYFSPGPNHPFVPYAKARLDQAQLDQLAREQRQAQFAAKGKVEGARSPIAAYRRKHPTTPELMEWLGFTSIDGGRNWHHVSQGTNSYATELFSDGALYSLSGTVCSWGGYKQGQGHYFQDTYDIMCAIHYRGNREAMYAYAQQCLAEEDDQPYGWNFMVNHGRELWEAFQAYQLKEAAESLAQNNQAMADSLQQQQQPEAPGVSVPEITVSDNSMDPDLYTGPPLRDPWFESLLQVPMLPDTIPPGIVGDLFRYARKNTVTAPLPEMLLPMALAFTSTMSLNSYYVERVGLNNAYVVVADTAVGKSSSFSPFRAVLRELEKLKEPYELPLYLKNTDKHDNPTGGFNFIRGWPSHGNSFHKRMAFNPTLLAFCDEFGANLLEAQTNQINKTIVDFITKAITASGPNNTLSAMDYTDADKTLADINGASFNLLGLMVPSQWEKVFTRESAKSGAANRRLVFEEKKRPGLPMPPGGQQQRPPQDLVTRIASMTNYSYKMWVEGQMVEVQADDLNTAMYISAFNRFVSYQTARRDSDEEVRNMWARIHVHCLKVAATVAVGVNHLQPRITMPIFQWAQQFVAYSHARILWRLNNGQYDGNPNKEYQAAKEAILHYITMAPATRASKANASGTLLDPVCVNMFRVTNIAALLRAKGLWDSRVPKMAVMNETAAMLQLMADDGLIEEVSDTQLMLLKIKQATRVAGNKVYMATPVLRADI